MAEITNFVIKPSPIHGVGLFTKKNYSPNEKVTEFISDYTNSAYINHSCSPTCYFKPPENTGVPDILYAGENGLKEEDEITVDFVKEGYTELWDRTIKGHCTCLHCINEKRVEIYCRKYKEPDIESECIKSIIENTDWPFKLTLYDTRWEDAREARMWNRAIKESTCNYIVFIDTDTKVSPGWLSSLMKVYEEKGDDCHQ